jgi:itaconate CoA-transferase
MDTATRAPLRNLTVVAIEQAVSAPFCSARLADAGARVIKIERPEGDFARGYDTAAAGESSYFVWLNRGKESLVLDLASTHGKRHLRRLLASADIVVQNLKPGALERLGFGIADLRRRHPPLIVCSISGYGAGGPLAERKAYDLLMQAESGLCSLTGSSKEPVRVGISLVDIATGATAYGAILEALIARGSHGRGADLRISMFDVIADWLTVPLLQHEAGQSPQRMGLAHPSIAPYGAFRTRHGKDLLIAIQSEREWVKFCKIVLRKPEAATDQRFAGNAARVRNRAATDELVARCFGELDQAAAEKRLEAADIAFSSVNDMAALSAHPHLRRITVMTAVGPVSLPAPASVIVGVSRTYGPVPKLDDHQLL